MKASGYVGLILGAAVALFPARPAHTQFIGDGPPTSFALCEEAEDDSGAPRVECQAADVRFDASDDPVETEFGFAIAVGHLNGDDLEDLVVGDPLRNRVYVFFGRSSVTTTYGLAPGDLADREVSPDSQADVILEVDPAGQVGSFGFSVAVGRERISAACPDNDLSSALLIGAPGTRQPGDAPGTAFYFPAGALCMTPSDPPATVVLDPFDVAQTVRAPVVEDGDEFGYSVAFGRVLSNTGTDEDVVVGARAARGGEGRVTVFPVADGVVDVALNAVVEIAGAEGDGLGEAVATGDLDQDLDPDLEPFGDRDDLAIGAVGHDTGKVVLAQGPLSPTGGTASDGVFAEGDGQIQTLLGEIAGDYFGFSVALSAEGRLAVGAVFATNDPPTGDDGGNPLTNVGTGERINAGKTYLWDSGVFDPGGTDVTADTADDVLVARRSGDQLGFGVAFVDLDDSGEDDFIVTARREDGSGLTVDEIDQGTAYVVLDDTRLSSPVDLDQCVGTSDCTGVGGIDVMIFGGDRLQDAGDEIGFAVATGDFNGDDSEDVFVSSMTQNRVYAVTLQDSDDDRETEGRNIRDDDDDNDGDTDSTDCGPLDDEISSEAAEIACNGIDENCNGMADDAPDADGDGFDACGDESTAADCDDADPDTFPGAPELCDGNDNACDGTIPSDERDLDDDGYTSCSGWDDTQGDNPEVLGDGDCRRTDPDTFPGAAPDDSPALACMTDADGDDFGDSLPPSGATAGSDCDDDSATTFPGAAEIDDAAACMSDDDDDGYGDSSPTGAVDAGNDCDDDDPVSFPGAVELCDGNDNGCAGALSNDEVDLDTDGFVVCATWLDRQGDDPEVIGGGDCAEVDADTFPGAAPNEAVADACMQDRDGDDYGDLAPPAGVTPGTDCDDVSADTFPGAAAIEGPFNCMKDSDDDDYGDDSVALPVVPGTDCDDDDATRFATAPEIPDDGIDQDCNGSDTVTCFVDEDLDGFGGTTPLLADDGECTGEGESDVDTDCDDADDAIHPDATEIPDDGIDQNCDGTDAVTCFVDADQDGSGTVAGETVLAEDGTCDAEQQESATSDDCDDADASSFPGAPELCDGNDNGCSGAVGSDEVDLDADGYVACNAWNDTQGDDPAILGGDDCGPSDAITFPGAAANEPLSGACMRDADGDDYGDVAPPAGVAPGTDCDDASATTFPGAAELDGPLNCMRDVDADGYGDSSATLPVVAGTDCDDADPTTFSGAPERCDGNDNACAGSVPVGETDSDADGYVECAVWNDSQGDDPGIAGGGDCGATDPLTFPGAAPAEAVPGACMRNADGDEFGDLAPPAGVISGTDCDDLSAVTFPGAAEIDGPLNCMRDADDDGYGDAAAVLPIVAGGDCDDASASVSPGTIEGPAGDLTCSDGIDNDCDGLSDAMDPVCDGTAQLCPDADADGFADCVTDPSCDSTGLRCGDCDDGLAAVNPDAVETCDNRDDNCNATVDEGFDQDGDNFTTCALPVADCDDGDATINPGSVELCDDGADNDCDAATPDIFDGDSDGATCDVDCNDGDPGVNPGAAEVCNDGVDNDCDVATPDLFDGDSDGAACDVDCDDADPALNLDDADSDLVTSCAGDCDDADAGINPTAMESCDGRDNDCDGTVDEGFDQDGDSFTTCQQPVPDCNDADSGINPGAMEVCNDAVDNDCNAATPDVFDIDQDGVTCDADCDEGDATSFPGAPELCDGNDNACVGMVSSAETDTDGDGFVACSGWNDGQGDDPAIAGGGDCDPAAGDTFPGAAPSEAFFGACMRDGDGDDYGDLAPPAGITPGTDCDDASAVTFPGAAEIDGPLNCMKDADDDGFGDDAAALPVVPGGDCDDDGPTTYPGAPETCEDGIDSDCDGLDPVCPRSLDPAVDGRDPTTSAPARPRRFSGARGTVQVAFVDTAIVTWLLPSRATLPLTVYRGDLEALRETGTYTQSPGVAPEPARFCDVGAAFLQDPFVPSPGKAVYYLVTGAGASGESSLGVDSAGVERANTLPCPAASSDPPLSDRPQAETRTGRSRVRSRDSSDGRP